MIEFLSHLGYWGCRSLLPVLSASSGVGGKDVFSGSGVEVTHFHWTCLGLTEFPCTTELPKPWLMGRGPGGSQVAKKGGRHAEWVSSAEECAPLSLDFTYHPKMKFQGSDNRTLNQTQEPVWTSHMPMDPAHCIALAVWEQLLGPREGAAQRHEYQEGRGHWGPCWMLTTTSNITVLFWLVPFSFVLSGDLCAY